MVALGLSSMRTGANSCQIRSLQVADSTILLRKLSWTNLMLWPLFCLQM